MIKIKMKRCIALMLSLVTLLSAGLGAFPNGFAFAENEEIATEDTVEPDEALPDIPVESVDSPIDEAEVAEILSDNAPVDVAELPTDEPGFTWRETTAERQLYCNDLMVYCMGKVWVGETVDEVLQMMDDPSLEMADLNAFFAGTVFEGYSRKDLEQMRSEGRGFQNVIDDVTGFVDDTVAARLLNSFVNVTTADAAPNYSYGSIAGTSKTVHIPELGKSGVFAYQSINGKRVLCFALGLASVNGKKITSSTASNDPVYTAGVNYMEQNGTDEAYCLAQAYVWAEKGGKSFAHTYAQMMYSFSHPSMTYDEIKALNQGNSTYNDYYQRAGAVYQAIKACAGGTIYINSTGNPLDQPVGGGDKTYIPVEKEEPVNVEADRDASKNGTITQNISINKTAGVTGEKLSDIVFDVYYGEELKGTVTTDANGHASCSVKFSVEVTETGHGSDTQTFKYHDGDIEEYNQKKAAAEALAQQNAEAKAQQKAEENAQAKLDAALAGNSYTLRIVERQPEGFALTSSSVQEVTLTGNGASAELTASNEEWKAKVVLNKTDADTGNQIKADTVFSLYEWNGTSYVKSSHYQVIRLSDGTYTVQADYAGATQGYVYYTQANQGKFQLIETKAATGYFGDYAGTPTNAGTDEGKHAYPFEITAPDTTITISNNGTDAFTNPSTKGRITVYKLDADANAYLDLPGVSLDGAIYDLYAREDIAKPDGSGNAYTAGEFVASQTIVDGKLDFDNIYPGKYNVIERVKETNTVSYVDSDGKTHEDVLKVSFAPGYLVDETVYPVDLVYGNETQRVVTGTVTSREEIIRSGFALTKLKTATGETEAETLKGAGFSVYRISDLSKADQFTVNVDGSYDLASIREAYVNRKYNNETKKYDFSGESTVTMIENGSTLVDAYNETLQNGVNGRGEGWVATGNTVRAATEYQLSEVFTNDAGILRVGCLPHGQYLVVETTTPSDVFTVDPFIVTVNEKSPSTGYMNMRYFVDEEFEAYIKVVKTDAETSEAVRIADTAFQIINRDTGKLVTMEETRFFGLLSKTVDTFYTNEEGMLVLPELLPKGNYRLIEAEGPEGYYNEYAAKGTGYVDFSISTDTVYQATGDKTETGRDVIEIALNYANHETIGTLTLKKMGEVLTGTEDGDFVYEAAPFAGAEFSIYADGDIVRPDGKRDENGEDVLWYADGDLVTTVVTGAKGQIDETWYAPNGAVREFLCASHDGTEGTVTVTLPQGNFIVKETKAPYGHTLNTKEYHVSFTWENERQEIVVNSNEETANNDNTVTITNKRVRPVPEDPKGPDPEDPDPEDPEERVFGIGVHKKDAKDNAPVAGARFALYTADDIYDIDGNLLFAAGDKLSESGLTDKDGLAVFAMDVPIRGEHAGENTDSPNAAYNTGHYLVKEFVAPDGYLLNDEVLDVYFTYEGQDVPYVLVETEMRNNPTTVSVLKTDKNTDKALAGATLAIVDESGKTVDEWVSEDTAHVVNGLLLSTDTVAHRYVLIEKSPAAGYTTAEPIPFYLTQECVDGVWSDSTTVHYYKAAETGTEDATDTEGTDTEEDVTGTWQILAGETEAIVMEDDITRVEILKVDAENHDVAIVGAVLQLKDSEGNVVDTWTTDGTAHAMEKLPKGTYTLYETTAPTWDGYATAEPLTFTVADSNEVQTIVMYDPHIKVQITKADITTCAPVIGATVEIINAEENVVESWLTEEEPHMMDRLPAGEYTLRETQAPTWDGYVHVEDVKFTVTDTSEIQMVEMLDDYTKVAFNKLDATDGTPLAGAKLQFINAENEIVDEWLTGTDGVDEDGNVLPHVINYIPTGTYRLHEADAAPGYLLAEDVIVEVTETAEVQTFSISDVPAPIYVDKLDAEDDSFVAGAKLSIKDAAGNTVDEWTTDETYHEVTGLKVANNGREYIYTLTEETPAIGYATAEPIRFTVCPNEDNTGVIVYVLDAEGNKTAVEGDVTHLRMYDEQLTIAVTKRDITTGEILPGATLAIKDADGTILEQWVSEETAHIVKKLPEGTFILSELNAPEGFEVAEDMEFKIVDTRDVQEVILSDIPLGSTISLTKVDAADNRPLAGAEFTVFRNGEAVAKMVTDESGHATSEVLPITQVTNGVFEGFIQYTVIETKAPEGYFQSGEEHVVTITEGDSDYDLGTITNIKKGKTGGASTEGGEGTGLKPKTGDETPILPIAGAVLGSLALMGIVVIIRRKNRKEA